MNNQTSDPTASDDSVANQVPTRLLELCPECAYRLDGLPDLGNCPECGTPYDQSVMILPGGACGSRATLADAGSKRFVWELLYPAYLSYCLWIEWSARKPFLGLLTCFGTLIFANLLLLVDRFTRRRPGLVHVYLGSAGCLQYRANPRTAWYRAGMICTLAGLIGSTGYLIYGFIDTEWVGAAVASAVTVVFAIFAVVRMRHLIRRDANLAPLTMLKFIGTPWRDVKIDTFEAKGENRFRMRLQDRKRKTRLLRRPVDLVFAELTCSDEQALRAIRLIREWLRKDTPS